MRNAELKERKHLVEMTGQEAAVFCGISYDMFKKHRAGDDPPPMTFDRKFRSDELGEWVRRHERKKLTGKGKGPGMIDPIQERARKDREMADKYELENQVKRGELIDLATVESAAFDVVMRVRSRLMRMPSAVAPLLLGLEDRIEIQEVLDGEVRDALTELSGNWTGASEGESDG